MRLKRLFSLGPLVAKLAAVRVMWNERVAQKDLGGLVIFVEQVGLANGKVGGRQVLTMNSQKFSNSLFSSRGVGAVRQVFFALVAAMQSKLDTEEGEF